MTQVEGFAAAPQGTVTRASHEHVTKPSHPSSDATNTFKSGEAGRA